MSDSGVEQYNVTVEDVNIADPEISFNLIISESLQSSGSTFIIEGCLMDNSDNSTEYPTINHPGEVTSDLQYPISLSFDDDFYDAGHEFEYIFNITFYNSASESIHHQDIIGAAKGQGGTQDFIVVPFKIGPGQKLQAGEYFRSSDRNYFGYMDHDEKFKIYRGFNRNDTEKELIYSSSDANADGGNYVVMQHDGNFCMYNFKGEVKGSSFFESYPTRSTSFVLSPNETGPSEPNNQQTSGGVLIIQSDESGSGGSLAIKKGDIITPIIFNT